MSVNQLAVSAKRLFVSACVATGTTGFAARRLGVDYFLPQLFVTRYAAMGGLDPRLLAEQLAGVHSFADDEWCSYWNRIAEQHESTAQRLLREWDGPGEPASPDPLLPAYAWQLAQQQGLTDTQVAAVWEGVKASTYYAISAFPGGSPARMRAYHKSRELGEANLDKADLVPLDIEWIELDLHGETVRGYAAFPRGNQRSPLVIVTNGLEGTVQELALPMTKYWEAGLAVFVMEMPGSYAYRQPMSGASERIYHAVIEHFAAHPRVDNEKMAMVGVSFGGYWSARMAAASTRLACVVAVGAPTHHTFGPAASIGIPHIIVSALMRVTGSSNLATLMLNLRKLSFEKNHLYEQIHIPLLVINGDHDTLVSVRDSIDLAAKTPAATLKLYPDDHCAMGHLDEWMDCSFDWLRQHLT
jgi:esterase FrsA